MSYLSERRIDNFRELYFQDYGLFWLVMFLHIRIRDKGLTIEDLCANTGRGRTYVKGILDAEPAPYGPSKRKEGKVFLDWLRDGVYVLEEAL
jgi:hypothetical protein